jgi:hypothetical protein
VQVVRNSIYRRGNPPCDLRSSPLAVFSWDMNWGVLIPTVSRTQPVECCYPRIRIRIRIFRWARRFLDLRRNSRSALDRFFRSKHYSPVCTPVRSAERLVQAAHNSIFRSAGKPAKRFTVLPEAVSSWDMNCVVLISTISCTQSLECCYPRVWIWIFFVRGEFFDLRRNGRFDSLCS